MISDVLFEASEEIGRYLRDFDCYSEPELRAEIERVRGIMDALRRRLDDPPVGPDARKRMGIADPETP